MTASNTRSGDRPVGSVYGTRSAAMGRRGMIATSQPLASAAGLAMFQSGGNAIDAALAAAAVLAVVEPTMTGIGGDLFALVVDGRTGALSALDACGRSPGRLTPAVLRARGITSVPAQGVLSISVPGVVDGWARLAERFGTRSLADLLAPAIRYAADGYPVHAVLAGEWAKAATVLAADAAARATFLAAGRAPTPGEIVSNPRLAASLEAIARDGRDAFYTGSLAAAIAADVAARDGLLDEADLAAHQSEWVTPLTTSYRGCDVYEMPPSTQGFVALEMLNLLEGVDVSAMGHNSAAYLHAVAEAKKIAFADRGAYLADRDAVPAGAIEMLVSKTYAADRRRDIDAARARSYTPGRVSARAEAAPAFDGHDRGDTVYLTAADGDGNIVSLIQSLFSSFGSGVVAGDTGIALHNRGSGFVFDQDHPNAIGPSKHPLHTLVPAMVFRNGRPWLSFGVMGGDNQAQAHVQVLANLIDFGFDIQTAGEAARMRHTNEGLALESGIDTAVRDALSAMGHTVIDGRGLMGGFQGIMVDPSTGVLAGGSDPRKDGTAIGL